MSSPKILVIPGSARKDSFNRKLAVHTAKVVEASGGEATLLDMNAFDAPLYHGDLETEHGMPERMQLLRRLIKEHDALIVISPEYNGHVPPLLVNAFDWVSRPDGEDKANAFAGKTAAVMAASPGRLGGIRMLPRLRAFLSDLGVLCLPSQVALGTAFSAFDDGGKLTDERAAQQVETVVARLIELNR
ncbi:NAD(P)H-dependent oxidoreductase [Maricaulis sp.]|uniref:NADPH-dependent FMN reductase n=1 Tax=Maricaulis sp. TaxID=1486257 RepID=UPI0026093C9F|nr:NAD(P)H-dependent oxidoreductase [Maricaulis sp.]